MLAGHTQMDAEDHYHEGYADAGGLPSVDDLEVAQLAAEADIASLAKLRDALPVMHKPVPVTEDENDSAMDTLQQPGHNDVQIADSANSERYVSVLLTVDGDKVAVVLTVKPMMDIMHDEDDDMVSEDSEDEDIAEIRNLDEMLSIANTLPDDHQPFGPAHGMEDLPALPDLDVKIAPEDDVKYIGKIKAIIDAVIVIQGLENSPAFDQGSLLCTEDRAVIGLVEDIFGPVLSPMYTTRHMADGAMPAGVINGGRVYAVSKMAGLVDRTAIAQSSAPRVADCDDGAESQTDSETSQQAGAPSKVHTGQAGQRGGINDDLQNVAGFVGGRGNGFGGRGDGAGRGGRLGGRGRGEGHSGRGGARGGRGHPHAQLTDASRGRGRGGRSFGSNSPQYVAYAAAPVMPAPGWQAPASPHHGPSAHPQDMNWNYHQPGPSNPPHGSRQQMHSPSHGMQYHVDPRNTGGNMMVNGAPTYSVAHPTPAPAYVAVTPATHRPNPHAQARLHVPASRPPYDIASGSNTAMYAQGPRRPSYGSPEPTSHPHHVVSQRQPGYHVYPSTHTTSPRPQQMNPQISPQMSRPHSGHPGKATHMQYSQPVYAVPAQYAGVHQDGVMQPIYHQASDPNQGYMQVAPAQHMGARPHAGIPGHVSMVSPGMVVQNGMAPISYAVPQPIGYQMAPARPGMPVHYSAAPTQPEAPARRYHQYQ